jgi:hypothetical protein
MQHCPVNVTAYATLRCYCNCAELMQLCAKDRCQCNFALHDRVCNATLCETGLVHTMRCKKTDRLVIDSMG